MLNKLPFVCKLGVNLSKNVVLTPLSSFFHSSAISNAWSGKERTPTTHVDQNNVVFSPQSPDEEPRKAVSKLEIVISKILLLTSETYWDSLNIG